MEAIDLIDKTDVVCWISEHDRSFCDALEQEFDKARNVVLKMLQCVNEHEEELEPNQFFISSYWRKNLEEGLMEVVCRFVQEIMDYFRDRYGVVAGFKREHVAKRCGINLSYLDIVHMLLSKTGGLGFEKRGLQEVKEIVRQRLYDKEKKISSHQKGRVERVRISGPKVSLPQFLWPVSSYSQRTKWKAHQDLFGIVALLRCLNHFETGSIVLYQYPNIQELYNALLPLVFEREKWLFSEKRWGAFNKARGIELFKGGQVYLYFSTPELANQFAKEYF